MNKVTVIVTFILFSIGLGSLQATRLVTYRFRGESRAGGWLQEGIVDVNRAYRGLLLQSGIPRAEARAAALVPSDLLELLKGERESLAAAKDAIGYVKESLAQGQEEELKRAGMFFSHEEVELTAPLPNPPRILAIGLNYRAHAEETGNEIPQYPTVFTKEGKVIGPSEPIIIPAQVKQADYEVELAFVMSRPARNVPRQEALEYVGGYMTFNDVSARDIQGRVSQWTMGKSPDTFSVMGPYLVLSDEIPDPQRLVLKTRMGEEVLQESSTADMIFTVAELVAYISQFMILEPGTVVITGTPSGVGAQRSPPRFLKPGDTISVEVEKLGVLSNPVRAENDRTF